MNYKEAGTTVYSLEFYETSSGNSQVRDFLSKMSGKGKAKFFQIANLLKEAGPEVRMPYSRYLDDGIFEVRVIVGNDSSRVLYFFMEGQKIIFTNGFVKKTQKTPRKEIETAIRYRADYLKKRRKNI